MCIKKASLILCVSVLITLIMCGCQSSDYEQLCTTVIKDYYSDTCTTESLEIEGADKLKEGGSFTYDIVLTSNEGYLETDEDIKIFLINKPYEWITVDTGDYEDYVEIDHNDGKISLIARSVTLDGKQYTEEDGEKYYCDGKLFFDYSSFAKEQEKKYNVGGNKNGRVNLDDPDVRKAILEAAADGDSMVPVLDDYRLSIKKDSGDFYTVTYESYPNHRSNTEVTIYVKHLGDNEFEFFDRIEKDL